MARSTPETRTLIIAVTPNLATLRVTQMASNQLKLSPSVMYAVRCHWRTLGDSGAMVLPSGRRDGPHMHSKHSDEVIAIDVYRNGLRHGLQHTYYEPITNVGMQIYQQSTRIDGVRQGCQLTWHPSGTLHSQYTYVDGVLHGLGQIWYKSGQLACSSMYANGLLHGEYRTWYESGQLRTICTYVRGRTQGDTYDYYESGQLRMQCSYVNDVWHGHRSRYHESGPLHEYAVYVNGKK